jgi:hypothetical protein
LSIFFDGVHQHHNTYTIASSVVTFDTAIPTGTANVEIHYGKQPVASALAANVIDSEHYVDGSIDLAHMSSQSVDEDNLHISNSGSNGQFLSKQSGDAGGLTWAAAGGGKIAQVVRTVSNTEFVITTTMAKDTSIPQISEGTEIMTAAITPTAADSILYIECVLPYVSKNSYPSNPNSGMMMALFVDTTANALHCSPSMPAYYDAEAEQLFPGYLKYSLSAASTTARTYKLRCATFRNLSGLYLNRDPAGTPNDLGDTTEMLMTVTEVTA